MNRGTLKATLAHKATMRAVESNADNQSQDRLAKGA